MTHELTDTSVAFKQRINMKIFNDFTTYLASTEVSEKFKDCPEKLAAYLGNRFVVNLDMMTCHLFGVLQSDHIAMMKMGATKLASMINERVLFKGGVFIDAILEGVEIRATAGLSNIKFDHFAKLFTVERELLNKDEDGSMAKILKRLDIYMAALINDKTAGGLATIGSIESDQYQTRQ